jgi:uncharacterized protein YaaQ
MKMILAILRDEDNEKVSQGLLSQDFRVTRIASTGGWLRRGNTTLMIGVDDEKVEPAIAIIRENCQAPDEPGGKRATLFILNVAQYEHL